MGFYAYTFCVQDDVIKVYDNTHDKNADNVREKIERFRENHPNEAIISQQKAEKDSFLKNVNGIPESVDQYVIFSCTDGCFYSALKYVATDPEGLYFADTLLYTIEG